MKDITTNYTGVFAYHGYCIDATVRFGEIDFIHHEDHPLIRAFFEAGVEEEWPDRSLLAVDV